MSRTSLLVMLLAVWSGTACPSGGSSTSSSPSTAAADNSKPVSTTTASEGTSSVTTRDEDKPQLLKAYRDMYRAMLAGRTDELGALLDDEYSLTHITGKLQPKREWLAAIDSGQMLYHAAEEKSVSINVTGDTAVVVGKSVVTTTIYGAHGTWHLQLTTDCARKDGHALIMTLIDSRSFMARYPSGTPSMSVTRSKTRPGWIMPSRRSGAALRCRRAPAQARQRS